MTVWESTVDNNTWKCEVTRTGERTGQLKVTNVASGKVILDENVGLSYGAIFGPDVDDLHIWQDRCIEAIDNQPKE